MADSDLTIVILRNIQEELASHREGLAAINQRLDATNQRLDSNNQRLDELRDQMMHQFAYIDRRVTNVEDIAIKTATSLGIEAQSSRHRTIRTEGEIAELKVRVAALEAIVKDKPTP